MKTNNNKRFSRRNDRKVLMAEESTKSWADSDSETSSTSSSSSDDVMSLFAKKFGKFMRKSFHPSSPYNNFNKSDKATSDLICYNCDRPGHFAAECNRPKRDNRPRRDDKRADDRYKKEERYKRDEEDDEREVDRSKDKSKEKIKERSKDRRMKTNSNKKFSRRNDRKVLMAEESTKSWADSDSKTSSTSSSSSDSELEEVHCFMADQTDNDEVFDFANSEFTRWLKNKLNEDKAKAGPKFFVPNQPRHYSRKAKTEWTRNQPRRNPYGQNVKSKFKRPARDFAHTFVDPRTGKTVRIVQIWVPKGVATDVEPIQIVDPTQAAATDTIKKADAVVVMSTVEADIAKDLEETLVLGVTETKRESQGFDEALFEEDFARWLDDFVARHNEPELVSTNNEAQATGGTNSVVDKEVNMPIDDLLIQISDDLLLPITAAEVTMIKLGAFSSFGDKGKAKLGEDEQVTDNAARKLFALICRDVEVLVQVRDILMQAVKDLGDTEEVVLTGVEEEDLVSSDVSTVYRSPSPPSPGVDSLEHDLRFALGPAIFSHVEQEERLYFVQSPDSQVVLTGVEEVDLVSSDVSTVYRSPSPPSPGVDSLAHDLRFALGPSIFSHVEQEERLYFVQSPDSPPAVSPHHESSSSSTDVSLHFDSTDVPAHAQAATHVPASVDVTKLAEILEDLQSSLTQPQITDLKKGLMGPVGTIFGDLFDIKKTQREQDARLIAMDEQIAAIRNEHLDFQSKIAADILSLSTQVGDIADFLRSGVSKKGEMASSSRSTTVRAQTQTLPAQTQTLPPTTGTFEERVAQARRHIIETGQVISIEEAAARVMEADRRESERMDRERRERRQTFRKQLAQHDIVCLNGFDDVSHSKITRHHDVTIIFNFNDLNRHDDVSSAKSCKWKDMMTSSVLIFRKWLNLVYCDKSLDSKEMFIHLLQGKICR
ncbi:hypothetical protein F511_19507 [Dorcoceras hygrometricum]|uniref:CCHC-type domain-containing protein n=1 Tax=Dorcoceras hygrometricum TaxID=472368 RepID=A0A2Z7D4V7_9LAMI|nr:hypothetical protein F511_19507 [Dorcoceras hygrometricum]